MFKNNTLLTIIILGLALTACGKAGFSSTEETSRTNSLSTDLAGQDEQIGNEIVDADDVGENEVHVEDVGFSQKASCGKSHQSHKVLVCHIPSGNIDNRHEICISKSALKAHIGTHGDGEDVDFLGSCE